MAKKTQKKSSSTKKTIETIRKKKIKKQKASKIRKIQKKNQKRKKFSSAYLPEASGKIIKKIVLPRKLLELAKSKIDENSSLKSLKQAIQIYDIDDEINYNFLNSYKNINRRNFKYLYTLSFDNRKKIIKKYKMKQKILTQSSKIILFNLTNFLINNKYQQRSKKLEKELNAFELKHFEKFIIPISEGTYELQYYYFVDIILQWLKNGASPKKIKIFLSYFKKFFNDLSNLDKIDEVFYIIFRLDLMFFNKITDHSILKKVQYSIDETIEEKFQKLLLIKDQIKENIDTIIITDETTLTLKENNLQFKPAYYSFGTYSEVEDTEIFENIVNKTNMSYKFYKMNRLNYFSDDKKKVAFISLVNIILSSKVIREYYQKVYVFQDYEFPFEKEEIFNYLWSKVIFTDLDNETWGITNREGFGIFINRDKGNKTNGLGYGANIITVDHEFLGHFIKYLVNSNNQIKAGTATPNESFIDEEDNLKSEKYSDGGDKFEILLFGQRVENLTIGGNHFIFDIKNWSLSLNDFQKGFKNNNSQKIVTTLKYELINIKKNELVRELFQDINYRNVTDKIESQSLPLKSSNKLDSQELSMKGFR